MDIACDLEAVWDRLSGVKSLVFKATSGTADSGWNGEGRGSVAVETVDAASMLFHEGGKWRPAAGRELTFTNTYRWTALRENRSLRLEHLRFGYEHPVYLFDLSQTDEATWQSIEPHVCREDFYTAVMTLGVEALALQWTIQGPTKNERISYSYQ